MDDLFAAIAASSLPGDVKTDVANYLSLESDSARRDEMLKLVREFANLNGDEARAFEDVMRSTLADAQKREAVSGRKASLSARDLADKVKGLAAIESIKKSLHNTPES